MKKVVHRAADRGHAQHGWLESYHSFSFADYRDPERIHFGALRVLNDDTVAPGMGFGTHPHDNMEIISIPLSGALRHRDTLGTEAVIRTGDVQIMSAGSGLQHSEVNHSRTEPVQFLQVWVFPKLKNIEPRYEQKSFGMAGIENQWQLLVSPDRAGGSIGINQDAWFSRISLSAGSTAAYHLHQNRNGIYLFVLEGGVTVAGESLGRRDGMGVETETEISIVASQQASILVIEIPMRI